MQGKGGNRLQLPGYTFEPCFFDILSILFSDLRHVHRGFGFLFWQFWNIEQFIALKHCTSLQLAQFGIGSVLGQGFFVQLSGRLSLSFKGVGC